MDLTILKLNYDNENKIFFATYNNLNKKSLKKISYNFSEKQIVLPSNLIKFIKG